MELVEFSELVEHNSYKFKCFQIHKNVNVSKYTVLEISNTNVNYSACQLHYKGQKCVTMSITRTENRETIKKIQRQIKVKSDRNKGSNR